MLVNAHILTAGLPLVQSTDENAMEKDVDDGATTETANFPHAPSTQGNSGTSLRRRQPQGPIVASALLT